MATQSIIAAVISKFESLSAANFPGAARPGVYFAPVPQTDAAGAQITVTTAGYVALKDNGQDVQLLGFERQTNEVAKFDFEVYYPSLGDVDTAVLAIKRNGGTATQGLGFDFGTLSDLASPRGTFEIVREREQRGSAGLGKTGAPVHFCRLSYRVVIQEST